MNKLNWALLITLTLLTTIAFWGESIFNILAKIDSELYSSFLVLILGIPIALWVDRKIVKQQQRKDFHRERLKEEEILKLVLEELNFSLNSLFLKGKKGNVKSLIIQPLKSSLWGSLASGGDLKYIAPPSLLNRISSAYYVLNIVKDIEKQAFLALRSATVTSIDSEGKKVTSFELLLVDARRFDRLFEDSLNEAIKAIEIRLVELQEV